MIATLSNPQVDIIIDQCMAGQKIQAIKLLRDCVGATKLGLKEAKDIIDTVMSPTLTPQLRWEMSQALHAGLAGTPTTIRDDPYQHQDVMLMLKGILAAITETNELLKDLAFEREP